MGRKADVSLYRLFSVDGTHRYVRIVKSGRGWTPKTEAVGEPGAYYLRFLKNGSRTFESVGDDIHVALQEQKARQQALDTSTEPIVPAVPPPKTLREHISQFAAKKDGSAMGPFAKGSKPVSGKSYTKRAAKRPRLRTLSAGRFAGRKSVVFRPPSSNIIQPRKPKHLSER